MICDPCKAAGKRLKLARTFDPKGGAREITRRQAEAMHADCEYPDNCPCQHRTELDLVGSAG